MRWFEGRTVFASRASVTCMGIGSALPRVVLSPEGLPLLPILFPALLSTGTQPTCVKKRRR
jgi:hypothetical protein